MFIRVSALTPSPLPLGEGCRVSALTPSPLPLGEGCRVSGGVRETRLADTQKTPSAIRPKGVLYLLGRYYELCFSPAGGSSSSRSSRRKLRIASPSDRPAPSSLAGPKR